MSTPPPTPATPAPSTPVGVAGPEQQPDQPVVEPPPIQVAPTRNSRLERLHAEYTDAKAALDDAAEKLKAITDGIKVELSQAAPEQLRVELVGAAGPRLRMSWVESWRVDARKLKAEDPETYVRFARKSGSWTLKVVASGGEQ